MIAINSLRNLRKAILALLSQQNGQVSPIGKDSAGILGGFVTAI